MPTRLVTLDLDRHDVAVDVLGDAFRDYPVMRWVLGRDRGYEPRLRRLVGLFVANRAYRGHPMIALQVDGAFVGVVTMTLPGGGPVPADLEAYRERTWSDLGAEARQRYEAFAAASAFTATEEPHHHVNMLGVRLAEQGKGFARILLDAAHALAAGDPASAGVSLSTELRRNLTLYEHFGYRVASHARVSDTLETWTLFRPRDPIGAGRSPEEATR